jgi:hypothetical protein
MKVLTEDHAAWNQDLSGTGLLESASDSGFAACFENAGTEEQSLVRGASVVGSRGGGRGGSPVHPDRSA